MAKCAKCGTQKLSERPCPKCGWGDPEVTNQTEQIVTRAEAVRLSPALSRSYHQALTRSYLRAMEALQAMIDFADGGRDRTPDVVAGNVVTFSEATLAEATRTLAAARALLAQYEGGTE